MLLIVLGVKDLSRRWVKEQAPTTLIIVVLAEVKHLHDGVCDGVKRALANALAVEPVVLDESQDRGLIGHRVVHEVLPRPRRDNK